MKVKLESMNSAYLTLLNEKIPQPIQQLLNDTSRFINNY